MRRSEIVGLDCAAAQTLDRSGWIEILEKGVLVTLRGRPADARSKSGAAAAISPVPSSPRKSD